MAPQVGIREALGAITFPEFILEQGEGCGRMLNLAIRIWVCFLDAPELVPKIDLCTFLYAFKKKSLQIVADKSQEPSISFPPFVHPSFARGSRFPEAGR